MSESHMIKGHQVHVTDVGLTLDGVVIEREVDLATYEQALGCPSSTISAGGPPPVGHRNNQIHLYHREGIYLTEHHATRLIGSICFVFDCREAVLPLSNAYNGELHIGPYVIRQGVRANELVQMQWKQDMPGCFHIVIGSCWIGAYAVGQRKRGYLASGSSLIAWVSVCPGAA